MESNRERPVCPRDGSQFVPVRGVPFVRGTVRVCPGHRPAQNVYVRLVFFLPKFWGLWLLTDMDFTSLDGDSTGYKSMQLFLCDLWQLGGSSCLLESIQSAHFVTHRIVLYDLCHESKQGNCHSVSCFPCGGLLVHYIVSEILMAFFFASPVRSAGKENHQAVVKLPFILPSTPRDPLGLEENAAKMQKLDIWTAQREKWNEKDFKMSDNPKENHFPRQLIAGALGTGGRQRSTF